jgi:hypothetical protein
MHVMHWCWAVFNRPTLYRFRVLLEDLSGNLQKVPDEVVWTYDQVAPVVAITAASTPVQLSARGNPEIFFDVFDENERVTFVLF